MATPVEMPKLGNTVEHCLLVAWHKHKGDTVSTGEVLAEMETDKATFDLTAPADGTLLELSSITARWSRFLPTCASSARRGNRSRVIARRRPSGP